MFINYDEYFDMFTNSVELIITTWVSKVVSIYCFNCDDLPIICTLLYSFSFYEGQLTNSDVYLWFACWFYQLIYSFFLIYISRLGMVHDINHDDAACPNFRYMMSTSVVLPKTSTNETYYKFSSCSALDVEDYRIG